MINKKEDRTEIQKRNPLKKKSFMHIPERREKNEKYNHGTGSPKNKGNVKTKKVSINEKELFLNELKEGYISSKQESLKVSKEFETSDFEHWNEY
jgi:hypothetical protein